MKGLLGFLCEGLRAVSEGPCDRHLTKKVLPWKRAIYNFNEDEGQQMKKPNVNAKTMPIQDNNFIAIHYAPKFEGNEFSRTNTSQCKGGGMPKIQKQ